jgi:hypothetical protein
VDEVLLAKPGYLLVDFIACVGDPEFLFIDNPTSKNPVNFDLGQLKNGKQYRYIVLPRSSLYVVVRQKQFEGSNT